MHEQLARFGHHPDPAVDFCVEVEAIAGLRADFKAGFETLDLVRKRVAEAMQFRVGGNPIAIRAKGELRQIEHEVGR